MIRGNILHPSETWQLVSSLSLHERAVAGSNNNNRVEAQKSNRGNIKRERRTHVTLQNKLHLKEEKNRLSAEMNLSRITFICRQTIKSPIEFHRRCLSYMRSVFENMIVSLETLFLLLPPVAPFDFISSLYYFATFSTN